MADISQYLARNVIELPFLFLAGIWIVNPRNLVSVNGERGRNLTKYLMGLPEDLSEN